LYKEEIRFEHFYLSTFTGQELVALTHVFIVVSGVRHQYIQIQGSTTLQHVSDLLQPKKSKQPWNSALTKASLVYHAQHELFRKDG
jgi:hypothetical protein